MAEHDQRDVIGGTTSSVAESNVASAEAPFESKMKDEMTGAGGLDDEDRTKKVLTPPWYIALSFPPTSSLTKNDPDLESNGKAKVPDSEEDVEVNDAELGNARRSVSLPLSHVTLNETFKSCSGSDMTWYRKGLFFSLLGPSKYR